MSRDGRYSARAMDGGSAYVQDGRYSARAMGEASVCEVLLRAKLNAANLRLVAGPEGAAAHMSRDSTKFLFEGFADG